jgi:tetratricopeptide (TPR) repeat protein
MMKWVRTPILVFLLFYIYGCAPSYYTQGRKSMEVRDYDAAIDAFQQALQERPDDPRTLRDLGIIYYIKTDFNQAIPLLIKAFLQDSTDGRTLFYLGTAYEITKDYRHAIDIYRRYTEVSRLEDIRNSIEARLTRLLNRQLQEDARAVLAQEESIDVASIPEYTVAVLYFRNMGENRELDPLQKGMADMVITDLSKVKKLKIVERVRMQKMMEEMGLGMTGLVSNASAPRVGRLLGASNLVNGTYLDLLESRLRINAGLIDTKEIKEAKTEQVDGDLAEFFRLEKDLVFKVIDGMGITLSQAERDEIEEIPTENLLAFMAYCRGLDYEDRGMFKEAAEEYEKAVDLDPDFDDAETKRIQSVSMTAVDVDISDLVNVFVSLTMPQVAEQPSPGADEFLGERGPGTAGVLGGRTPTDHLIHMGDVMTQVFLPGIDSRNPAQEESQSSFGSTANFEFDFPLPRIGKRR